MKKLTFILIAFFCFSSAFSLAATVVSVSGKVEIREGYEWVALKAGDVIEKGAVISTGYKSEAKIKIEATQFTIGALTRLTIEDLVSDNEKDSAQIFLDAGKIKANVKSAGDKRTGFKVRSPVATASVRGTEFEFSARGRLFVTEGTVSFFPTSSNARDSEGTPVSKGQSSEIESQITTAPSEPSVEMEKAAGLESSVELLSSAESIGGTPISSTPGDQMFSTSNTIKVDINLRFHD